MQYVFRLLLMGKSNFLYSIKLLMYFTILLGYFIILIILLGYFELLDVMILIVRQNIKTEAIK